MGTSADNGPITLPARHDFSAILVVDPRGEFSRLDLWRLEVTQRFRYSEHVLGFATARACCSATPARRKESQP